MFFSLIDHYNCDYYDEIVKKNNNENQECIICLERGNTVLLQCVYSYIKICNCNVSVHAVCLEKWYKNNMTCIICKTNVVSVKTLDVRLSIEKRKQYIRAIKFVTFISTILNLLLIYELYRCIVLESMLFIY